MAEEMPLPFLVVLFALKYALAFKALPCRVTAGVSKKHLILSASTSNSADNAGDSASSVGFGKKRTPKSQQKPKRKRTMNMKAPKVYLPAENIILPSKKETSVVSQAPPLLSSDSSIDSSKNAKVDERALCHRMPSKNAAEMIIKQYERGEPGLLVITTDASGGSGRFNGLCAILRHINNDDSQATDSVSIATRRTRGVQQCTGKRKSRTKRTSRARRIGSGRVLGVPAEISAVSLGLRAALSEISPDDRSNILLLVDCERAITYMCDGLYEDGDPVYRALQSLAGDTNSGAISIASVASVSKLRFDGFFDHAAADYLAGIARGKTNPDTDRLIDEDYCGIKCKPLNEKDLEWLGLSEDETENMDISSGSLARDREEGRARIHRLTQRISEELTSCALE